MLPTGAELERGLAHVREAPSTAGVLELIVCRPEVDLRDVLDVGVLDERDGLVGDSWSQRGNTRTADGLADPLAQLNIMSARAAALIAGPVERWPLAGDQLYLDIDLSAVAVPPGTRFAIGDGVIEITAKPHLGCVKFSARFGREALALVNSEEGKALNLRGRNARVVQGGTIRVGDAVHRA